VSKESLREGVRIRAWLAEHASELPDRERQVAQLVYLDGHAARWVARTLEISRASVRSYLQRIKARLTDSPESDSQ
jgi:RNA polymerase sigma factor (sigma-70 family)